MDFRNRSEALPYSRTIPAIRLRAEQRPKASTLAPCGAYWRSSSVARNFMRVRPNDETLRVPQGIFKEVLAAAAPCLILLDELADYCVGAAAVPVGETTLAAGTFVGLVDFLGPFRYKVLIDSFQAVIPRFGSR